MSDSNVNPPYTGWGIILGVPTAPTACEDCGWPVGGTGNYVCPCGNAGENEERG